MSRRYGISEQEEILREVEELINNGSTQANALKQIGVSQTAYANWKRAYKARNFQSQDKEVIKKENDELLYEYNLLKEYVRRLEEKLGQILIERELSRSKQ